MNTAKKFKNSGYIAVRDLIDTADLYKYAIKNMDKGMEDPQVPGSSSFYQEPKMTKLHLQLLPKIEKLTGLKLFKTYVYHRVYRTDAVLRIHRDRPACEISVTLNLGGRGKPWPLWILDYDENPHRVILNPGDAVIYHGCDLNHWRGKLKDGDMIGQVFMHYVDQNGPNAAYKDDHHPKKKRR